MPLFSLVFGQALNILNDATKDIVTEVARLALYFFLIAIGAGGLSFVEVRCAGGLCRPTESNPTRAYPPPPP